MQLSALPVLLADFAFWIPIPLLGLTLLAGIFLLVAPKIPFRALFRLSLRLRYRVSARGLSHLPDQGPALMVCSRGHYLDWLPLLTVSRRPIRFFIYEGWTSDPETLSLLQSQNAIVLNGSSTQREAMEAIQEIRASLKRGELVCIFLDEHTNTTGAHLPFHRLYKKIMQKASVPVVPISLDYPLGSPYRLNRGRHELRWKWLWRYPVWISIEPPIPESTPPEQVAHAVTRASSDMAIEQSWKDRPVHREFVRYAARHPFQSCMIDSLTQRELSYGKALAGAMCLANLLRSTLQSSNMVGIWLPPGLGSGLSNIALALLGKTSVNLNYTASTEQIHSAINQCDLKYILTARRFVSRMPLDPGEGTQLIYLDELMKEITGLARALAFLKVLLLPGAILEWFLGLRQHRLEDIVTIIFSSGSTGDPKGVMLSHRNVRANAVSMISTICADHSDRILGILPLFHSFGFTVTLWVPLQIGASVVYHTDPRQAREIGELSRRYRCTVFLNTATFLRFCLLKCQPEDFDSIRLLCCGAEKLPQQLAANFEKKFSLMPLEGYGSTELTPVVAVNLNDVEVNGCKQIRNRPGTIGLPLRGVSVRVIDPDTLEPLPPGSEGLLVVSGANVMEGYLHRPDLTNRVVLRGQRDEHITGDMARCDADGCIMLTGRLSRFAKIGGEMVPLEAIEEHLEAIHPTTERTFAVVAVPDEKKGERLIVLYREAEAISPDDLCSALKAREVHNLWLPSPRDFYAIEELPVLGTGKLDLKRLKELALDLVAVPR